MKPNFALNLSHDGIGLLHRKKGSKNDWTLIGEVAIDDPALSDKLAMLRRTAADLEKGGLATKLLIPNSQILYTEVDAPGPDDISREVQIRNALEGATPYEVGELVFDWRKAGGTKVKVAVLARETLAEAEGFAKEHRFNPVSFVARPSAKGFKGEVFFGKAKGAAALLGAGEHIEPDQGPVPRLENLRPKSVDAPIKAIPEKTTKADTPQAGEATPVSPPKPDAIPAPKPDAKPDPKPTPKAAPIVPPKPAAPPKPPATEPAIAAPRLSQDADDARVAALLADVAEPARGHAPAVKPTETDATPSKSATVKTPADMGAVSTPVLAPFPPTPDVSEDGEDGHLPPPPPRRALPTGIQQTSAKVSAKVSAKAPDASQSAPQAPAAHNGPSKRPPVPVKRAAPTIPAAPISRTGPAATPAAPAAFSSRRDPGLAGNEAPTAPAVPKQKPTPEAPKQTPAKGKSNHITSPSLAPEELGAFRAGKPAGKPAAKPSGKPASVAAGFIGRAGKGAQGLLDRTKSATSGLASRRAKNTGGKPPAKARTPIAPTGSDRAVNVAPLPNETTINPRPGPAAIPIVGAPKTQSDDVQREVDRMTMFGARKSQKPEIGGKHKYLGLFLTLTLLLVMAIVALSSMFFFSDNSSFFNSGPEENPFAVAAVPDVTLVAPESGALPDPQTPTEPPPTSPGTASAALQPPVLQPGTGELPFSAELLNDIEPEPIDTTSAAQPGTPATTAETPPEILPPLTASPQILTDDAAQARYTVSGVWQKAPAAPAEPQGSRIDDLYIASIDPAISSQDAVALPSEVTRSQEARPASPLPPPAAGTEFALDTRGLVTPSPEGTLSQDGVLIYSGRPEFVAPLRPGSVAPVVTAPDILQELRPKPRPEGLVEDNERANLGGITRAEMAFLRPNSRPASLQSEASAEDGGAPNDLAVAASPAPGYRPGNFATIVTASLERAATLATAAAASDGSSVSAAPSAGPQIPTRASVATQATIDNALRLNEINLIGIYGASSSRRALVRLKSGRYIKVSVGDRLNGGQVLSISETRLIYKKNNRNHTLDMLPLG